jgi:hypothetical protein
VALRLNQNLIPSVEEIVPIGYGDLGTSVFPFPPRHPAFSRRTNSISMPYMRPLLPIFFSFSNSSSSRKSLRKRFLSRCGGSSQVKTKQLANRGTSHFTTSPPCPPPGTHPTNLSSPPLRNYETNTEASTEANIETNTTKDKH